MVNRNSEALWTAVRAGDVEAVDRLSRQSLSDRLLLRPNAIIDAMEESSADEPRRNQTPLFTAASAGNAQMCQVLIRNGATIDSSNDNEDLMQATPLHGAAANGHVDACNVLIDAGAEANEHGLYRGDVVKQTILHSAAQNGHADVCVQLLTAGAPVDALADGFSPLHLAAKAGSAQTCSVLIEAGAEVNLATLPIDNGYLGSAGQTPLHLATSAEVARALLVAGANAYAMDNDGELPGTNADYPDVVGEISAWRTQNELAAQGFSSEEEWREAARKEAELDRRQQEAEERRQQGYYDAQADNDTDRSPQERAALRSVAAAAEAGLLNERLEANTAPAPARYATDDDGPWTPTAADTERLERSLAGVAEGEPIVYDQAPLRSRGMRL